VGGEFGAAWGKYSKVAAVYEIIGPTGGTMRARRALLYMPGDDRHKIEKALTLDVDCICMDMEDGVALNRKPKRAGSSRLRCAN